MPPQKKSQILFSLASAPSILFLGRQPSSPQVWQGVASGRFTERFSRGVFLSVQRIFNKESSGKSMTL
jgi:hypothetical protein